MPWPSASLAISRTRSRSTPSSAAEANSLRRWLSREALADLLHRDLAAVGLAGRKRGGRGRGDGRGSRAGSERRRQARVHVEHHHVEAARELLALLRAPCAAGGAGRRARARSGLFSWRSMLTAQGSSRAAYSLPVVSSQAPIEKTSVSTTDRRVVVLHSAVLGRAEAVELGRPRRSSGPRPRRARRRSAAASRRSRRAHTAARWPRKAAASRAARRGRCPGRRRRRSGRWTTRPPRPRRPRAACSSTSRAGEVRRNVSRRVGLPFSSVSPVRMVPTRAPRRCRSMIGSRAIRRASCRDRVGCSASSVGSHDRLEAYA